MHMPNRSVVTCSILSGFSSRKEHLESQNQAISLNEFTGDLQDWMRRISLFRSIGVKIECRTDGLILKWRWINAT